MKNIFKITAIITTLLITLFASGCGDSPEQKKANFEKLENQCKQQIAEITTLTAGKAAKVTNDIAKMQLGIQMAREIVEKTDPILKEMEKTAKGVKELEDKTEMYKKEIGRFKELAGNKKPSNKQNTTEDKELSRKEQADKFVKSSYDEIEQIKNGKLKVKPPSKPFIMFEEELKKSK